MAQPPKLGDAGVFAQNPGPRWPGCTSAPAPVPTRVSQVTARPRASASTWCCLAALVILATILSALVNGCGDTSPAPPPVTAAGGPAQGWPFDAAEARRRQAEAAESLGGKVEQQVDLGGGVKLDLALVPAGQFLMGSPVSEAQRGDDESQHQVTISKPFWMGKYEVTQEQWQAIMGSNPSRFQGSKNPVEMVSWDDCRSFVAKLNEKVTWRGFRLPTEAEWEWACRAGAATRFSFGDSDTSLAEYAWFDWNSSSRTHQVGEKKPNAWGLYDMHGNVWEWCASPFTSHYDGNESKSEDAPGRFRVLRGGSWSYRPRYLPSAHPDWSLPDVRFNPRYCRSAFRVWDPSEYRLDDYGCRVVCSARTF